MELKVKFFYYLFFSLEYEVKSEDVKVQLHYVDVKWTNLWHSVFSYEQR